VVKSATACVVLVAVLVAVACSGPAAVPVQSPVERGKFLVTIGGCNDCHTPLKMGAKGPEPDLSRLLSGHPSEMQLPPPPALPPGPWMMVASATATAYAGPWGISYSANLTPDPETGIGAWEESTFIQAMRTGKHLGGGREILPPMPWQGLGTLGDDDLKAIFAYLRSVPPIKNRIPEPSPPPQPPAQS
jgi:cytochrome c553